MGIAKVAKVVMIGKRFGGGSTRIDHLYADDYCYSLSSDKEQHDMSVDHL